MEVHPSSNLDEETWPCGMEVKIKRQRERGRCGELKEESQQVLALNMRDSKNEEGPGPRRTV